LNPNLLPVNI